MQGDLLVEEEAAKKAKNEKAEPAPLAVQRTLASEAPPKGEEAAVFYFSMGQAFSLDSDPQRAIEAYRATLTHDPNSALVRARLAAELVKVGSYAEAKTLCEEAIALDPKYVDSYLLLAGIQVAAKEYDAAINTYKKALEVDPNNRDALLYNGVALAEIGKTKEGVAQLERLVKLKDNAESNIDKSVAYYYLAKVYEESNQKPKAIQAYEQALKQRPGFSKAALALADIYIGQKQETKAHKILEEAFRESRAADIAERLAENYLEKGQYKEAIVYLETLVEEDPTNENVKLRLALVYWQVKWFDKARLLLSDLHDRYPASSEIAFYLGELELERGDLDGAVVYYKKISPDYTKYDQMVSRVASLYRQKKEYEVAEDFVQEAMRKRADLVVLYPLMAALYEDQKKLQEAKLVLERGLKLFPEDENILYYLGFVYDRQGAKEKALAMMEKLLSANPNNANALNFVGYTLLEKGENFAKATAYLERAVALKPNDPFVLDSYGWLLYRLGRHQEAMKQLEKAYAAKPDESVIAEHLADVYVALKMPRKALAVYEQALKHGGEEELLARVQIKIRNVQEVLAGLDNEKVQKVNSKRRPASQP